ncbi:PTS sugar transporter subunit IIA [Holdemania filiformis]|uniref:PTS sugar transporter subunit IIA n=1 Tax=Holdemania filiformis TaxID=61171 RepID=UPI00210E768B|nr:PTS glucose transporter subunit IIA [Holdemania filiformis]MCQ4951719.1 PTS glucose transporter subunit IIA [Holdemania filiformis]
MEICYSPLVGKAVNLDHVADEMFSQRMLGDGMAIAPEAREVYSPVAGEITMVYETQHAIGIKTETGIEILLHIGIDTVMLGGERRSTPRCRSAITFSPAIC